MSRKNSLVLTIVIVAIVAMVSGFCFVFLGNDIIKIVPQTLKVEQIENDFYLMTDYNSEYGYQFKLEQFIDQNYVTVSLVDSKINTINLSKQNINIIAGKKYRFSACFTTENGAGNGSFSQSLEWVPTWTLENVDYDNARYDELEQNLSWNDVYLADEYVVRFVNSNGDVFEKKTASNSLSLQDVAVDKYKIYIMAKSTNDCLKQSNVGEGINLVLCKKNEILQANKDSENAIRIVSTQKVESFELYVDGNLRGVFSVTNFEMENGNYVYNFDNAKILLNDINFELSTVQIKSNSTAYVKESDLKTVE